MYPRPLECQEQGRARCVANVSQGSALGTVEGHSSAKLEAKSVYPSLALIT